MKNQDGSLNVQRDATFLAESGVLPKVGCPAFAIQHCSFLSCDLQAM